MTQEDKGLLNGDLQSKKTICSKRKKFFALGLISIEMGKNKNNTAFILKKKRMGKIKVDISLRSLHRNLKIHTNIVLVTLFLA